MVEPLRALSLDELRTRTSEKWREYGPDVLPLFVAEHDFALAPTIASALHAAVARSDTGYTASRTPLAEAFRGFAERRWGWSVEPVRVRSTADVSMGIVEILRRVTAPGDRVVVTPPVYPPFYDLVAEAGAEVERVPLVDDGAGWHLDLAGIDDALAQGARAVLLCNPHNPTGTVHERAALEELARIAARHDAAVVSDEIHAPLTQPDVEFVPFLTVSDESRRHGFAVASASKAFNLAGLKCALMVTAHEATTSVVRGMPAEVEWRTGHFGMTAAVAAFDPASDAWLAALLAALDENRRLVADELARHLPGAGYRLPAAGYLAWIDLRSLGWGDAPARRILRESKVALTEGAGFGVEGRGWVRLNFGTSPEIIREAITRIAAGRSAS